MPKGAHRLLYLILVLGCLGTFGPGALGAGGMSHELRVVRGEVELAGTLVLPAGAGPFPVVILIHGSEPGRRTHPGYLATARLLGKRGVGALIWDKRGVGDSTGTYVEAPDLGVPAADVIAWVDLLQDRGDVQPGGIGVLGWSQGGWIGPLAASLCQDISFVIAVSGPGVSPLEQAVTVPNNARAAARITDRCRSFIVR